MKLSADSSCYFLSLKVKNVSCFGKAQPLNLTYKDGSPARWTVIIGDNGMGKTTLLRSLVGITPYNIEEVYSMVFASKNLGWNFPRDHEKAEVEATFSIGYKFTSPEEAGITGKRWFKGNMTNWDKKQDPDTKSGYPWSRFVCHAYGASRRMGKSGLTNYKHRFMAASLFDDDAPLINAEDWLLQADYISAKEKKYLSYKKQVENIILNLLPDVKNIDYHIDKRVSKVLFETSFGWVGIDDLSLGYRTMLSWMVDFAARLFERYPDSKNPLEEPAVLLVDEIDLHLHPQWQRILIDFLTERFPNTQFIASAHSPLLVQAAASTNLVLLKRQGNQIIIDNDPVSVENWRVDQILTSDLFGLDSPRSKKTERLLKERTKILSKPRLTEKDNRSLKALKMKLSSMPFGDTPKEIQADFLLKEIAKKIKADKDKSKRK
ncbi:MAG: AAA family ATPase [Candidatus Aminicenantes bacterium]|nr:AAA family ATPase [Candidatus Aminicenantes bacterium]